MINFRFHLVSLVAVFLALTVGIVVGASIVNRAIVDGLNNRIDKVEKNADTQRAQNGVLSATAKRLGSYLDTSAPYVVEGRLTAVPAVVTAERGIDRAAVRNLVTLLQDAGAQAPAIVWLEPKWNLAQPADRVKLAQIIGDAPTSPTLRADAIAALARRLGTPVSTGSPTSVDLLSALAKAGFVSIEAVGASGSTDLSTFPTGGVRASVVGGEASDLAPNSLVTPLAAAFSALKVPTVAAEVYHATNGRPPRATTVATIRNDGVLSKIVSTVDDVDLIQGQVAVVLATDELGQAKVGHYGYGAAADQALPSWSGP
jgi:hypothetical protein